MNQLINVVPIDGRKLDKSTARASLLQCIEKLERQQLTAIDEWMIDWIMAKNWGLCDEVTHAIENFKGCRTDYCFLASTQQYYRYGLAQNDSRAYALVVEAVSLGDPSGRCQTRVGRCFQFGFASCQQSYENAVDMYRRAIRRGNAYACFYLALMFQWGQGVPRDAHQCARLLVRAHLAGIPDASHELAEMMNHGVLPMGADFRLAAALYREAAAWGHEEATDTLRALADADDCSVVPLSCWRPKRHLHAWVTEAMHRQIFCVLLASKRAHCVFSTLPRDLLFLIFFFVCCRPLTPQEDRERQHQTGHLHGVKKRKAS